MNNWQYDVAILMSPWRCAMAIPHQLLLKIIDQRTVVVQEPKERWKAISQSRSILTLPSVADIHNLGDIRKAVDIQLIFSSAEAANRSSEFRIIVRASENFSH
jgi:sucrose-6-phosphate hydrolase SacC (GH32 family)